MVKVQEKVLEFVKNYSFLKQKYGEDAFQEGILNVLENKNLKSINNSYIINAIKWAFYNNVNYKNTHEINFDDLETENDINEIFYYFDHNLERIIDNIDLENKIKHLNEKKQKIIKLFITGYKQNEIKKILKVSNSTVCRTLKFFGKVKKRRKKIDKSNLSLFIDLLLKYGGKKFKYYIRLNDIFLYYDGRIITNTKIFENSEQISTHQYCTYIDVITLKDFEGKLNGIRNNKK